jgi:prepilin-type N-terminal cleavage/methylation domain-containing protein
MIKRLRKQRGFTLVEVIIALALLGIIAIAYLGGLAVASRAMITSDERTTAESLARSQMEYVKNQDYSDNEWSYEVNNSSRSTPGGAPSWWDDDNPPLLSSNYAGYSVTVQAEDFDADNDGILEVGLVGDEDEGIRKITVTVDHIEKPGVIILKDYKVQR